MEDSWLELFYLVNMYVQDLIENQTNGYYMNIMEDGSITGIQLSKQITDELIASGIDHKDPDVLYEYLETKNSGR